MRAVRRTSLLSALVLLVTLCLPIQVGAEQGWKPRPAAYGVVTDKDQRIRMSDGTVLVADVLRPARDGKAVPGRFPVLLTQTPYNKNVPTQSFAVPYLVERGYVQVIVDVRGTGGSSGKWLALDRREQRDGFELVAWAASRNRPWSNGRVGTYGISYAAINQFLTAAQHPPALKAMFPIVPSGDPYRDLITNGGQPNIGFTMGWFGLVTGTSLLPPTYLASDPALAAAVWSGHLRRATEFQALMAAEGLRGGDVIYDSDFWRRRAPLTHIDKVRTPTFIFGSWYDVFQRSQPMLYQRLRRNGVPAKLFMGHWDHLAGSRGGTLPEGGMPARDEMALRWMDRHLRGHVDATLDRDVAPVTYYEIGSGKYRRVSQWPATSMRTGTLRLAGPAGPGSPGRLTTGGPAGARPDTLLPVPVAGLCTRSANQWTAGVIAETPCAEDHRLNDHTGLVYDLPLRRSLRLLGPMNARLFLSTTSTNGLVSVRVEAVAPDGSVRHISSGVQVLSMRQLDRARSMVRDGRILQPWHPFTKAAERSMAPVMEVNVEIFSSGAVIPAGHTLRLALQAADAAHVTAPTSRSFATATGVLSVHHTPAFPSELVLPVVR